MPARTVCVALILLLGLGLGPLGCDGRSGPPKLEGLPLRVACTTTIVADIVKQVGAERVEVVSLMGPGVDPHKYIPASGDLKKLDQAHLVFFNGLHLEGKMADLFEKNQDRWRAFAVTRAIDPAKLLHTEPNSSEHDPHVWFDVLLWKNAVEVVRDELVNFDPDAAEFYRKNADLYLAQLDKLNKEIQEQLDTIPKERRVLVTSHDAFGYFGRAYGFEVIGLQGVSTASEVGTSRRNELARTIADRKIPAVFTETSVPDDGLKAVLDDVAKWNHTVKLVGDQDALFSDSLGSPGVTGATYIGMVKHNVGVIVRSLGK